MLLENSVALITGGAQGIGKELAIALIGKGSQVIVADINVELGEKLQEEYGKERLLFVKCDVTVQEELFNAFDMAVKNFGKLDIVCNNAGIMTNDPKKLRLLVAINLTAAMEGTFKGIEVMSNKKGGNGGVIINMASAAGCGLFPGTCMYPATKAGVVSFTRSFEFLPYFKEDGVRVNCLCPEFVDTEMYRRELSENPQLEKVVQTFGGLVQIDSVVKAMMDCLETDDLNGAAILIKAPNHVFQVSFPKVQPKI